VEAGDDEPGSGAGDLTLQLPAPRWFLYVGNGNGNVWATDATDNPENYVQLKERQPPGAPVKVLCTHEASITDIRVRVPLPQGASRSRGEG
jgi:hypothetical protein